MGFRQRLVIQFSFVVCISVPVLVRPVFVCVCVTSSHSLVTLLLPSYGPQVSRNSVYCSPGYQ